MCSLLMLLLRKISDELTRLLATVVIFGLILGSIILAWIGIGLEFSASRIFFICPLYLLLIGLTASKAIADGKFSSWIYFAVWILVAVNLISTFNFSRKQNFIQSTYVIPWEKIADDIGQLPEFSTSVNSDDQTLFYYLHQKVDPSYNAQVIFPENYSPIFFVYSPRSLDSNPGLKAAIDRAEQRYTLRNELDYLIEDETSVSLKSMILRRPVEPVKKVLRVYVADG